MNDKQATPERPKYNRDRIRHDIEHHVSIDLDTKTMEEVIDCVEDAITLTKWFADDETPDGGWVDVMEKPLIVQTANGWECTEAGGGEFIAAVPYSEDGEDKWWIKHCVVDDIGLCVVGDMDNEPAGWPIEEVTHYQPLPPPPQRVETNNH